MRVRQVPFRLAVAVEGWNVVDGVTLTSKSLVRFFADRLGWEVLVFTWRHPQGDPGSNGQAFLESLENPSKVKLFFTQSSNWAKALPASVGLYHRASAESLGARRALYKFRPHACLVNTPFGASFRMLKAYCNTSDKPLVMIYHSDYSSYIAHSLPEGLKDFGVGIIEMHIGSSYLGSDVVVTLSNKFTEQVKRFTGYPQKTVETLKLPSIVQMVNGIDGDIFYVDPDQEFGEPSVLWCARVVATKGPDVFSRVTNSLPVVATMVGSGPAMDLVGPHVHKTGSLPQTGCADYMRASDIFLFPSTVETFGNVIVEALMCGAYPIVFHQPGSALLGDKLEDLEGLTIHEHGIAVHQNQDQTWTRALQHALDRLPEIRRTRQQRADQSRTLYEANVVNKRYAELIVSAYRIKTG